MRYIDVTKRQAVAIADRILPHSKLSRKRLLLNCVSSSFRDIAF